MKSNIIKAMLLGLAALAAAPAATAQKAVPATKLGALVYGSGTIKLDSNEAVEMSLPTYSRYKFAVSGADWIEPVVKDGTIMLSIEENKSAVTRTATLSLRSELGASTGITVEQPGWQLADEAQAAADAMFITPVRSVDACATAAGRAQSSNERLEMTYDGNTSTLYHTAYTGFSSDEPSQWPVLEYYFTAADAPASESVDVESITYITRTDGGSNGNFGLITVEVGTLDKDANLTWTAISDEPIDLKMQSGASVIAIPDNMQTGIRGIRITVRTGASNGVQGAKNMASCAEMKFKRKVTGSTDVEVFADAICSRLKPDVTAERIEQMTDPFYKKLAQLIFSGEYDPTKMVSNHHAVMSPETLARQWQADGKCYDRSQGVTGVALAPGKYVFLVSDIPADKGGIGMVLIRWHGHEVYQNAKGDDVKYYAERFNYTLFNGINVIEVPKPDRSEADIVEGHDIGLVYINNFDDRVTTPEEGAARSVNVHIVGGLYNGYLSSLKTNAENQAELDGAVYPCIDLMGTRVHSVWQVNALKNYTGGQYVRYINLLDQIIVWEHRVLGLEKYNRVPENRTMTYVNYDYYMYQGGWGPTFKYDTQNRVCSPDVLMNRDSDAIWGLSHEWGHQHQMAPYFRWIGTAEVTNNIFSAYNVLHMGYDVKNGHERYNYGNWHATIDSKGNEQPGRIQRIFLLDNYNREITAPDESGETKTQNTGDNLVMSLRTDAAKAAAAGKAFWWCDELKQFALNQPKYPSKRFQSETVYSGAPKDTWNPANTEDPRNIVNPRTALNPIEAYSGNNGELILGPFLYLMYYFSEDQPDRPAEDYRPELYPDLFESLRMNDMPNGSTIEPGKTTVDKYELLTSIFNGNKSTDPSINKCAQFRELYPNSCWVKKNYIGTDNNGFSWTANSGPAIMNCIRKLSMLTGYNLWSYFEAFGLFTVCAIEQGDYGIQYYIMTDDMYDEFKADMDELEADGTLKPMPEELRLKISNIDAPKFDKPVIPNDRPITGRDN